MSKLGRHRSVSSAVRRKFDRLEARSEVKKIIIGSSYGKSHGFADGDLRIISEIEAGFKFNAYGSKGITVCYVYCDKTHKEIVKTVLES